MSAQTTKPRLISHEVFQRDMPICSRYLNVTDGRTDGLAVAIASHGKQSGRMRRSSPEKLCRTDSSRCVHKLGCYADSVDDAQTVSIEHTSSQRNTRTPTHTAY